ncbi:MAG: tetratricopeptide repeat protein [Anaerolineales bacterium]|nr:tetratricopeptide repeat protein [Anaerolineales bacterium]
MAEDTIFQDVIEALRLGDKPRAKELLTRLLKADQGNATYWLWMSAAVDNTKERVYCLQTALKLDPENTTAKRGLVLHGALPPDISIQPFPLNHPRAWEEKMLLASEKPQPTGVMAIASNPIVRLAGLGIIGILIVGLAYYGMTLPQRSAFIAQNTNTPGPSPTYTLTPTSLGAIGAPPTATLSGAAPLWMRLSATYTPTPLYVNTPRQPQSVDQYNAAQDDLESGNLDRYVANMRDIARLEGNPPDIYYHIAEAYRQKGDFRNAFNMYNEALKINDTFGPAYLGLARARLLQDPNADVTALFELALQHDPLFGEIYLERAKYYFFHKDTKSALKDLEKANELMPGSSMVQLAYAQVYLALDDNKRALEYAQKANELDITILPAYLILGETYLSQEQYPEAQEALQTYALYETKDARALALLGETYYKTGDYKKALSILDTALTLDVRLKRANYYRGLSLIELGNMAGAEPDLVKAYDQFPDSFELDIALTRVYYANEKYGSAYLQIVAANALDDTPQEQALIYYWTALIQEKRDQPRDALQEWRALLALPASAMTPEMRKEAQAHISNLVTPTATLKASQRTATAAAAVRTATPKLKTTGTPTPTLPKRTSKPPAGTATSKTPTPKVTVTPTSTAKP